MPSDTAPPLPPLFRRVAVLDRDAHAGLRLDPDAGYGFARATNAVPLALDELRAERRVSCRQREG